MGYRGHLGCFFQQKHEKNIYNIYLSLASGIAGYASSNSSWSFWWRLGVNGRVSMLDISPFPQPSRGRGVGGVPEPSSFIIFRNGVAIGGIDWFCSSLSPATLSNSWESWRTVLFSAGDPSLSGDADFLAVGVWIGVTSAAPPSKTLSHSSLAFCKSMVCWSAFSRSFSKWARCARAT